MSLLRLSVTCVSLLALSACATWSTSSVTPSRKPVAPAATASAPQSTRSKTKSAQIIVTETDITDRPYTVLGDISVTVNKTTIFNADPTKERVAQKLREEAATIGADAVVLVRYGTVGIGLMSWGSLDGKGRAVTFTHAQ